MFSERFDELKNNWQSAVTETGAHIFALKKQRNHWQAKTVKEGSWLKRAFNAIAVTPVARIKIRRIERRIAGEQKSLATTARAVFTDISAAALLTDHGADALPQLHAALGDVRKTIGDSIKTLEDDIRRRGHIIVPECPAPGVLPMSFPIDGDTSNGFNIAMDAAKNVTYALEKAYRRMITPGAQIDPRLQQGVFNVAHNFKAYLGMWNENDGNRTMVKNISTAVDILNVLDQQLGVEQNRIMAMALNKRIAKNAEAGRFIGELQRARQGILPPDFNRGH